ncbi:MFS transporter [Liquorilactobacillus capillatus]|uniref:Major facilitator superfamily permease n=1 Tax=Liquorilactobacillus capillatus DSM 19910 TaxID=1423731 RepID=A0A0R1LZL3_9LACO|nr:MFS transporter [Liquorilactobacillus capillatus]KRL01063.1 major facilitator superfamily permease [Liquorilactobacillus capillatus DSM 19910]
MTFKVKRAILILVCSEFLVCLGIGLVIPVMPFLKNEFHFSATDMGIMTSLFALAQFITSPIVGRLSDRLGRKPILIFGLLLYMFSEFLFAWGNSLTAFNISRIIGGLSAAMSIPPTMAMAADITTERQRAKVIGWISAAFSGALILGPGLGGILANIDYKAPFWIAGVLGFLSALAVIIFLPNDRELTHNLQKNTSLRKSPKQKNSKKTVLFSRAIMTLLILILVSSFGLQGFESIYSIYVNEVFNFSINNLALVLTLNGVISLILQVVFFERLVNWLQENILIRYCFLFSFLGTVWIILAHSKIEAIIATLIIFSAFDLLRPAITTFLTKVSPHNQGLINGLNMSLTSIGNVVGPIVSGTLLDLNHHYPYIVVATFLIVSLLLSFMLKKREQSSSPKSTLS